GDTAQSQKQRQRTKPPEALVTTPESLSVLLSYADGGKLFRNLEAVVVDEWHELMGNKRGVQLELCLARLTALRPGVPVWGLSATLANLDEARDVHEEILAVQGDAATPDDLVSAAEAMILLVDGYVSPEAESRIAVALRDAPTHQIGRYYAGLAMAQTGQYGIALNLWRGLLDEGPDDAPWRAAIEAQIGDLARAAGEGEVQEAPGPTREQMQDAQELAPEDRREMIEGMVARLEDRLATEGGGPEEWARLINAYGVLGRPQDAARIWSDAARAFAEAPQVVDRLREIAAGAGVDVTAQ
ncbi:MAG: DEAD/DEAH box helicase, partial [Pseudomonadota bacterium]